MVFTWQQPNSCKCLCTERVYYSLMSRYDLGISTEELSSLSKMFCCCFFVLVWKCKLCVCAAGPMSASVSSVVPAPPEASHLSRATPGSVCPLTCRLLSCKQPQQKSASGIKSGQTLRSKSISFCYRLWAFYCVCLLSYSLFVCLFELQNGSFSNIRSLVLDNIHLCDFFLITIQNNMIIRNFIYLCKTELHIASHNKRIKLKIHII